MTKTTFLLAGHGSRNRDGNDEIERFADQWRQKHPDWRIEVCFIEHADVLLNDGLDRAAKSVGSAGRVVLIPFILNAAGHVKMELPHALEEARQRHPGVEFIVTRGVTRPVWKPGQPLSSAISVSRSTLQAVAVETPVVSSVGASSLRSAATMLAFVTVRMAPSSCKKLTPPASGVPVPGKADGSRQSKSMVR